ncbi:MAG: SAM-dependent chlorinase/fluorinase [Bacteroidales bacterium]|nr:SAM-dependent chlorinase/fluorinase [Bacteroidales bacterium]
MPVITLTSDWSQNDYYLAAVKGQILKIDESIRIIDLNHSIKAFNTPQAAFVLRNSFHHFPAGSVHINFVNSERSGNQDFLAISAHDHYFIGTDNGAFSLIINGPAETAVRLKSLEKNDHSSFPGLLTFTSAACKLIRDADIGQLGEKIDHVKERVPLRATIDENCITGTVIYTDSYGNVITNINRELFERIGKNQSFEIYVQSKHYMINCIYPSYSQVPAGELVAVFNSAGLLEIAIHNGNAHKLLNLGMNSNIRIEFLLREDN